MRSRLVIVSATGLVAALLGIQLMFTGCRDARVPSNELYLAESRNSETVPRYDVFELSFKHNGIYENNFSDVDVRTIFTSPGGLQHRIQGFFYGADLWKVRFRPDEPGSWRYSYSFTGAGGFTGQGNGVFRCLPSDQEGSVRPNPENPFRWIFASGKPFFPVGLEDCVYLRDGRLLGSAIDGEDRNHPGRKIAWGEYFSVYEKAGFNLFRFSQKNCSYSLMDDLDHYRVAESLATDDLLSSARKHGFRVMFGLFGIHGNWPSDNRTVRVLKRVVNKVSGTPEEALWAPDNRGLVTKEKRFIDYCIARWGVYADFWELLNERKASDDWTTLMAKYIHSVDPDHKPISTSWEKPDLPLIDINAPHWYESENELSSDLRVQEQAAKWKRAGKPVVVGEQGNSGMNWDPLSAVRMRIRTWTALFQEVGLISWNTSWSKAGMFGGHYTPGAGANIYLGPEERNYIRVLQNFACRLDAKVRMSPVPISSSTLIRSYGLFSKEVGAVYLQHAASHTTPAEGAELSFDFSSMSHPRLMGEWIDPATGKALSHVKISARLHTLPVPSFNVDLAFLVTPEPSAPDMRR